MLGPYTTSVTPYCYQYKPPYYIFVPIQSPYCYYCAPQKPTIVIIVPLHYYCYVSSDYIMNPQAPIYRKEVFHLYHPRIVPLCNVKEVAPSKRMNSKAFNCLFYLFVSWFHNIMWIIPCILGLYFYVVDIITSVSIHISVCFVCNSLNFLTSLCQSKGFIQIH